MSDLIVGDPHLQVQRIGDAWEFVRRLAAKVLEEKPRRVIILGDLFHTFSVVRVEVLEAWCWFFRAIEHEGRQVILLVGNHDYASQSGGAHALEPFKDLAWVVQEPASVGAFHFMPFFRDVKLFEAQCRDIPAGHVLFCHQSFNGARFENGTYDPHGADPACVAHLSRVISGHVHLRQAFQNIWYPGTPAQLTFADAGAPKRVFLMDTDGGFKIVKEIDLGLPEFVQVERDTVPELLQAVPDPVDGWSYKLVATGTPREIADFWTNDRVKALRAGSRRVVDALVPIRPTRVLPSLTGATLEEKLNEFIKTRQWRTAPGQLAAAAGAILSR